MIAVFNRRLNWMECALHFVRANQGVDVLFPLCRELVAAGMPDGELVVYDEDGCHIYTLNSVRRGARSAYAEDGGHIRITKYSPRRVEAPPGGRMAA